MKPRIDPGLRDLLGLLVNALRGHLAEFGVIAPQGLRNVGKLIAIVRDERDARPHDLLRELRRLGARRKAKRRGSKRATLSSSIYAVSKIVTSGRGPGSPTSKSRNGATPPAIALAKRLGLRYVATDALSIRRRRCGRGWTYIGIDGQSIQDPKIVRRLARLAVPPAYQDVLYAADPAAHLQAVGRDAAGRLQYRYHSQWEDVRESRKARRLARLANALPQVRRSVGQYLAANHQTREFACAAVTELVACSAIRAGSEYYRRLHGTRGAVTLLRSNVSIYGEAISLKFRSKGGKIVTKEFAAPRLARVIALLRQLPGRRLFEYQAENVIAFEDGLLERFSDTLKNCRSPTRRAKVLAQIIAMAATDSSALDVPGGLRRRT
jgi:hypothetical protein